ncbi:TonB-dependent receptor [Pseudoalteromonas sp. MMG013]|uniref:TonB-dependent receptor plug domain-containing protein n=1 Tax=Pseudoalteromonas sp. MMG013 TaxID=2822687 RepID=UPI001B36B57B|nr:TonB-dependent receptor [Pseudoalteromonas sp. MMG013]MBQ4863799.1 TonB-dependent receptor [Pseudoalteromonas sp. MMG013]
MKKSVIALSIVVSVPIISKCVQAQEMIKPIEKIEVTGSKIKRSDMETASPVTIIGAEDIKASGAVTIDDILQDMTAAGGAMTNPGVNNGSGGNASINLRGMGDQRTLVLVNGRRMINSGTGAASTVDLNTIPISMVKYIEVLKDGASAVYGTDAVAGVVNIILKDDFEGAELNAQTGLSSEGDAQRNSIALIFGNSFDKGNMVFGLQYMDRGEASQADRDFSTCPITESDDGKELLCGGSSITPNGHVYLENGKELQGRPDGSYSEYNPESDPYNYSQESYLYTPMKSLNLTGLVNYELSNETTLFTEAMYTKRWSEQQMAPQPIWFDFTYSEAMGDDLLEHGAEYGDTIHYRRRMTDTGTRDFSQVVDTLRTVVGLEGILENDYNWDVALNFGRNDSVDKLSNLHNVGNLTEDIESGKFNPLDQTAWSTENMSDYIYTEQNTGGSQMLNLSASLSGELWELPAGYMGFATGVESRTEKAWYTPDSLTSQGLANDPKVEPTSGSYDVSEAFLELAVPVLADLPFAQSVDLSAAVRAFDYSSFGSDSTWKLGFTWKVNDELMFRGVRSTAFRAPTVDELYGGNSPSFEQINHALLDSQAEVTVGGNDQLTPEEANTITAGLVYEPLWLQGISMTLDYYDIAISNAIGSVDNQFIVDSCIDSTGQLKNQDTAVCQSANVQVSNGKATFNNQLQNIGQETTRGLDLNLLYKFEAMGYHWSAGLDTSFLHERVVTNAGETIDYTGLITSGSGGYADIKSNLSLALKADDWYANYKVRYISGMDSYACLSESSSCYAPSTPSVMYHDISGSYFINDSIKISAGINNLFDKQPPYYTGNNDSNTDPYTYDTLGRYFYAGVNVKF